MDQFVGKKKSLKLLKYWEFKAMIDKTRRMKYHNKKKIFKAITNDIYLKYL